MKPEPQSRITGILLENFMSIKGPYFFELAPTTLLFGPNSAGKSSIYKAIHLIGDYLSIREWREKYNAFNNLMPLVHKLDYGSSITISIRYEVRFFTEPTIEAEGSPILPSWDDLNELFPDLGDEYIDEKECSDGLIFESTFVINFSAYQNSPLQSSISLVSISESGLPLLEMNDDRPTIYLGHPIIKSINQQLAAYKTSLTDLFHTVFPEETHTVKDDILYPGNELWLHGILLSYSSDGVDLSKRRSKEMLDVLLRLVTALPLYHLRQLCVNMCHVGPLRQIPSPKQLTYFLRPSYGDHVEAYDSLEKEKPAWSWEDGSLAWKYLAENNLLRAYLGHDHQDKLIDVVNRWLVSQQRIGIQHRIRRTLGIVTLGQSNRESSQEGTYLPHATIPSSIVKLELEDVNLGIPVDVSKVGTGVSQLIPVLSACVLNHQIFIEQPELHLHPKLQTEIADFFISSFNRLDARVIIETHSEYLALRLLRRIRETRRSDIKHRDFSITENDVAFYYFDPLNGVTNVKRLRVDGNGDFVDRWPKGFFAEREAEIFDEDD